VRLLPPAGCSRVDVSGDVVPFQSLYMNGVGGRTHSLDGVVLVGRLPFVGVFPTPWTGAAMRAALRSGGRRCEDDEDARIGVAQLSRSDCRRGTSDSPRKSSNCGSDAAVGLGRPSAAGLHRETHGSGRFGGDVAKSFSYRWIRPCGVGDEDARLHVEAQRLLRRLL
jgi:hypothetical protein